MIMGLAKGPGRVDGSLIGVQEDLGFLLFFFACQKVQRIQAVVIRLVATGDIRDTVGEDFVIEGIQKDCP